MGDKDRAEKILKIKEFAHLRILADKESYDGKAKRCDTVAQLLDKAHWEITDNEKVFVWAEVEITKHDSISPHSSVGVTAEYLASANGVNIAVAYTKPDESGMRKFAIQGYQGAPSYQGIMSRLHASEPNKLSKWYSSWPGFSINNEASRLESETILQIIREAR